MDVKRRCQQAMCELVKQCCKQHLADWSTGDCNNWLPSIRLHIQRHHETIIHSQTAPSLNY